MRNQSDAGAELLDSVSEVLDRYVVLPDAHARSAVVLWVVATHAQPAWQHATRLTVRSPEKRCGKSRLLDLIHALAWRPVISANATVAALFRSIDAEDPPTLVLDEADTIFNTKASESTEELRGLLNAGFGRGRPALRCVGPKQEVQAFETFAMAALAAIGDLPDTITDRAVDITMRRRAPHEAVEPFRARRDGQPLVALREQIHAWARDHLDELESAEPSMPVEDRAADLWEPLVAVADAARGAWPTVARAAALAMTRNAEKNASEDELSKRFLMDIRGAFKDRGVGVLTSADLVAHLRAIEESPWDAFDLTAAKLAHRLRPYGVRPEQVRVDEKPQARGYVLEKLTEVFSRYLADDDASQGVTLSQEQVTVVGVVDRVTA